MGWASLIAVLIELFGPLLAELIRRWLDPDTEGMPEYESYDSPHAARDALFDRAIASARFRPIKRRLLMKMRHAAAKAGATAAGYDRPADPADIEDIAGWVGATASID
jgi:hypothetical protein